PCTAGCVLPSALSHPLTPGSFSILALYGRLCASICTVPSSYPWLYLFFGPVQQVVFFHLHCPILLLLALSLSWPCTAGCVLPSTLSHPLTPGSFSFLALYGRLLCASICTVPSSFPWLYLFFGPVRQVVCFHLHCPILLPLALSLPWPCTAGCVLPSTLSHPLSPGSFSFLALYSSLCASICTVPSSFPWLYLFFGPIRQVVCFHLHCPILLPLDLSLPCLCTADCVLLSALSHPLTPGSYSFLA
ncbi:hypothetical protein AB205_0197650, partial [Aquarana catesbeiana]